jgi:ankyrin repeat protein
MDAFFDAIKAGDLKQVKQMLAADPALVNVVSAGGSAVLIATYYGEPEIASHLIAQGATLNLFEACAAGQEARVRALLAENPALANAYAPDGFQPLGLAAFFGHTAIARLLLEQGAQVNSPSNNGQRVMPLHSSVAGGHLELSKLLLEHGADVNAKQEGDFTPLQGAAQNGQRAMVEMLLEYGADKVPVNRDGKSAVDYAREGGHMDVAALLGE